MDKILNKNEQKMSVEGVIFAAIRLKLFVSDYYLRQLYKAVRWTQTNHPGVLLTAFLLWP
jgi:hypothetical protein